MTGTAILVCAKHGTELLVCKQKVPGRVEVVPCPDCWWEALQEGQEEYRDRFVLGYNKKFTGAKEGRDNG